MKKVIFVGLESLEIMKLNGSCDTEHNNTINNNCDSDNNHNSDNHSNTVVNNNDNNSNNGK
jgi:hypothetical protein